ncbi:hypothetical protein [Telmatospirillum sp.]|uniref:hypothetical protein n=1 Tax=Telmatospirillum sp. TaxID=2079197 RepID=UPI00285282D8|nr:hypothetical protein [Telmatospirillum sp.]
MSDDTALQILRRIEPALSNIQAGLRQQGVDINDLKVTLAGVGGRLAGVEGQFRQLPTLWQIIGAVLGINAGIMALGFGLARLIH